MKLLHYERLEDMINAGSSSKYQNGFHTIVSDQGDKIIVKGRYGEDCYQIVSAITRSGMALYGKALTDLLLRNSTLRNYKFTFLLNPETIITNPIDNPTFTDRGGRHITVG